MATKIDTLADLAKQANYSLINTLTPDPDTREDGVDHYPREVFSGHYVRVNPTPLKDPFYVAHSQTFFKELGFSDSLASSEDFMKMFSADTAEVPPPLKKAGWATGYALSIYGTEYYEQCPFRTGNGYGDGRAISILEVLIDGKRWEMQLKGAGKTPYCRGADGRAVLRSSIREFLAQEHMYALGIPTSRSLTLYMSQTEKVRRPWFLETSSSRDPEVMIEEQTAITTRVAPSFLRVGQLELFGRRARKKEHPKAIEELELFVLHLIKREYNDEIDPSLPLQEKILLLAYKFRDRLTSLVAEWIRVGYCQGNFNSDNCALGGFTLDYGPFGFIDMFHPRYQPWTGGGLHFSFFNQPQAAQKNFYMFYTALLPLMQSHPNELEQLDLIKDGFEGVMQDKMQKMWASKLGLKTFDEALFNELIMLMVESSLDYTLFFRELSNIPKDPHELEKSFYSSTLYDQKSLNKWRAWLQEWRSHIDKSSESLELLSKQMKQVNPKYTLREFFLVPTYKEAQEGDYTLLKELQKIMSDPYAEHSLELQKKYYRKKPQELFEIAGVSHVSCSS